MDRLIREFSCIEDNDLMLCPNEGVAYQKDMSHPIDYDERYYNKCKGYEGKSIALKINRHRVDLVKKYHHGMVLDYGIGSGEFIRAHGNAHGYDINPLARQWLRAKKIYTEDFKHYDAVTLWDVIEHLQNPGGLLRRLKKKVIVFISLPIFKDLKKIRKSKHYRPNEHFYYWTDVGFVYWMHFQDFQLLERNDNESEAGRENITSFVFHRA